MKTKQKTESPLPEIYITGNALISTLVGAGFGSYDAIADWAFDNFINTLTAYLAYNPHSC